MMRITSNACAADSVDARVTSISSSGSLMALVVDAFNLKEMLGETLN